MLIDVISLDESTTLLMVPVQGGRLAIAPESEATLMDALKLAAR